MMAHDAGNNAYPHTVKTLNRGQELKVHWCTRTYPFQDHPGYMAIVDIRPGLRQEQLAVPTYVYDELIPGVINTCNDVRTTLL